MSAHNNVSHFGCETQPSPASRWWVAVLTCVAMLAFAANSLLTRLAFQTTSIDAGWFSATRLVSGALTLCLIMGWQGVRLRLRIADGWSALLLFAYVAAFSYAYRDISTGAGALVLFACAQLLMIGYGFFKGERTSVLGVLFALAGMVAFLMPSASAPPMHAVALMAVAGCAWGGFFHCWGRSSDSPLRNTASSFVLALPLALALLLVQSKPMPQDYLGLGYAVLSGSLASALGYVVWYWVRVRMTAISAGAVQLSVPIASAVLGVVVLQETISWQSGVSAGMTLAGVAWVTLRTTAGARS